jgi:hypothetical protein
MNTLSIVGPVAPRDVAEEIREAARCCDFLESLGVRIAFSHDATQKALKVELRTYSGRQLCRLKPQELFELIALPLVEVEAWVAARSGDHGPAR